MALLTELPQIDMRQLVGATILEAALKLIKEIEKDYETEKPTTGSGGPATSEEVRT